MIKTSFIRALACSFIFHGLLLSIPIGAYSLLAKKKNAMPLEVVLVNARHQTSPVKFDTYAQVNLNGGGDAKQGRAQSPLPNLGKKADGELTEPENNQVSELEKEQQDLLKQFRQQIVQLKEQSRSPFFAEETLDQQQQRTQKLNGMMRMEAELSQKINDYNSQPLKKQITPNTRELKEARYYKDIQYRIERLGTLNFPQFNGKKLYGQLIVSIPIFQDGSIYEKEGGPQIEKSSGSPALDRAALQIVRDSAPFPPFSAEIKNRQKGEVWEIVTYFNFTRDTVLQSRVNAQVY